MLDDHNKVKAIEGTEKLQEKIEKLDPGRQELVRASNSKRETFKKSFEQESSNPARRAGSSWRAMGANSDHRHSVAVRRLSFRKKYEYKGTEKTGRQDLDKITSKVLEVKSTCEPDSNLPLKPDQERPEGPSLRRNDLVRP